MTISKWKDIWQRFSGRGVYPHELAFLLDSPIRKLMITPQKLADHLHLEANASVLEIGPGPGYFSVEVASRIPDGRLVLFDIQSQMLQKSRTKLTHSGASNFSPVQGNAERLPFGNAAFDVAFLVTVLGEVPNVDECLAAIQRILRPGGLLSITEQTGDPDAFSQADLLQLAGQYGFEYLEQFPYPTGFTMNLRKNTAT